MFAFSKSLNPYLIYVNGIYRLSISSSSTIHISFVSTLSVFERVVGLSSEIVSVGLWSVRRIFSNLLRMKVPLPLFGLGHDGACTFRGAPLPRVGQA